MFKEEERRKWRLVMVFIRKKEKIVILFKFFSVFFFRFVGLCFVVIFKLRVWFG